MSSSNNLLQATLNRLAARLEERIPRAVAKIALAAKEAPARFSKEWELFKEEVYAEADRLNNNHENDPGEESFSSEVNTKENENTHHKINKVRAKIAVISKKIEALN